VQCSEELLKLKYTPGNPEVMGRAVIMHRKVLSILELSLLWDPNLEALLKWEVKEDWWCQGLEEGRKRPSLQEHNSLPEGRKVKQLG
jgi:hypothetical protein